MEKMILLINDFITKLSSFKIEMAGVVEEYNKAIEQIEVHKEANKIKEEELFERENKIKEIEDLVSLKQSTEDELKRVKEATLQLAKDRDAFGQEVLAEKKKIAEGIEKNNNENEILQKEWAALKKAKEDMTKKNEEFISRLLNNISSASK